MENQLQVISSVEALDVINRSELDVTIVTSKKFPRDLEKSRSDILKYATASRETAENCFYSIPRAGKTIEGPSVRLAEIINYCWGNINSGVRVIGNDGQKITAQAVAFDTERNNRITQEVSRNIVGKDGKTFTQDMQIVTGNAAGSIAWRNAIFRLIPNAVWIDIQDKIKKFIVGDGKEMIKRRDSLLGKFNELGVKTEDVLKRLNLADVGSITPEIMIKLFGLLTAINEGSSSVEDAFGVAAPKSNTPDMEDDSPANKSGELPLK